MCGFTTRHAMEHGSPDSHDLPFYVFQSLQLSSTCQLSLYIYLHLFTRIIHLYTDAHDHTLNISNTL